MALIICSVSHGSRCKEQETAVDFFNERQMVETRDEARKRGGMALVRDRTVVHMPGQI